MTRICPVCGRPQNDYNADYCLCGADLPDPKFALRDDRPKFRSRDDNYDNNPYDNNY